MNISDDFKQWIGEHSADAPTRLRLKFGAERALEILQIECRQKYAAKFSDTLTRFPNFIFPDALAPEQATSDRLAQYHSTLIGDSPKLLDMTAGLGIDDLHFALAGAKVTAVECRPDAAEALRLNSSGLNVKVVEGDSVDYLKSLPDNSFDIIYIDPARRKADGSRAYALADCEPDVTALMPELKRVARRCLIKMSPMLDVSDTAGRLGHHCIEIIATGNTTECRELLARIDFAVEQPHPQITAVILLPDGGMVQLSFTAENERLAEVPLGTPRAGEYLYELYPSVIKAGAFKLAASRSGLQKIHNNTHLYFSAEPVETFPGTTWRIEEVLPYSSGNIKRFKRRYPKISVAVRNFGISADELRRKLGVADGGTMRCIGVTDRNEQRLLIVISPYKKP